MVHANGGQDRWGIETKTKRQLRQRWNRAEFPHSSLTRTRYLEHVRLQCCNEHSIWAPKIQWLTKRSAYEHPTTRVMFVKNKRKKLIFPPSARIWFIFYPINYNKNPNAIQKSVRTLIQDLKTRTCPIKSGCPVILIEQPHIDKLSLRLFSACLTSKPGSVRSNPAIRMEQPQLSLLLFSACVSKPEEFMRWDSAFGIVFACVSCIGLLATIFTASKEDFTSFSIVDIIDWENIFSGNTFQRGNRAGFPGSNQTRTQSYCVLGIRSLTP